MTDTLTNDERRTVTVERRNPEGDVVDSVTLDGSIFGVTPNVPLLHQVVNAQLAARRSGTQSTRTRAEVAGGGSKPYRQKGTGRARQGSIRAPHYKGGGVALGPKPRSYAQRTPRKMTRLALCSALSDRASEGRVCIVDSWTFETPRTKDGIAALSALGLSGQVLVVLGDDSFNVERSFSNLPEVDLVEADQLTAYDVLVNDWIVFSSDCVPGGVTVVEGSRPAKKAPSKKAAATKATAKPSAETASEEDEDAEAEAEPEGADGVGGADWVSDPEDASNTDAAPQTDEDTNDEEATE